LNINGVGELGQALDAVNNLPDAIAEILEVTIEDAPITEGPKGEIVVDFSDGLAQHLNAAINDVVLQTVNNLIDAIDTFNITADVGAIGALPGVGSALQDALDRALEIDDLLTGSVSGLTNEIVDPIVNGTLDVVSDLAAVEVIGQTTADFAVGIQNPAGLSGQVPVYGGMVSDDFIDISLLNQGENFDNIYFDEEIDEEPDYGQPTVNLPITTDDTEITGTVDYPEVPVYVQIGEGEPQVATVDDEGNFTFPVEGLEEGTPITVYQEDEDGIQSEPITVTVEAGDGEEDPGDEDLFGPPTVDDFYHTDPEITGTVDPENAGYDVIIRDEDGEEIGRTTPDDDGNFSIPVEDLEPGQELEVVQVDEEGNDVSDPTPIEVLDGEEDEDPSDPELLAPPVVDDYYHTDPEITGSVDPENAGYDVIIRDEEGEEIGRTTPNEDGNFSIPVEGLEPGQELEVIQVDEEGNDVSEAFPIEVLDGDEDEEPTDPDVPELPTDPEYPTESSDELPPFDLEAPTVNPISAGDSYVGGQRRTDATLVATVYGQEIGRLDTEVQYPDGGEGPFTMQLPFGLEEGTLIRFYQEDQFGRRSSSTYSVVGGQEDDAELPELVAPTVNPITVGDETATGSREASMPLYAVVNGQVIATLPANPEASSEFELNLPDNLTPGTEISFYQVDAAGRQTPSTTVIVQDEDGEVPADTALPQPEVNPISTATQVLTGRRVGNATLDVIVNDEVIETLQPDEGFASDDPSVITMTDFEIELDETFPVGTEVTFVQNDEFGRTSEPLTVTVENELIIAPPEVDSKYEGDEVITGRKAQGSRVYARLSSDDYIGDNYSSGTNGEEQTFIPSLLRNAIASFAPDESDEVLVEVLAETANILLEDPLLPNGTEFEVQLSDEFPAGTTIELYQVNEFEGEEIVSDPTQIVVQPAQEELEEELLPPSWWGGTNTDTRMDIYIQDENEETLLLDIHVYRNGELIHSGTPIESYWSPTAAQIGFNLIEGWDIGDEIEVYRMLPDGSRGPGVTRIVEQGWVSSPTVPEIRTSHDYISGWFDWQRGVEISVNGGEPFQPDLEEVWDVQGIPMIEGLQAGDQVAFYGIGPWGVRSTEPTIVTVQNPWPMPYIHTATNGDTIVYVQPSSPNSLHAYPWVDTPVNLYVNGELAGTRLHDPGWTYRYTFVLDEPLEEGDILEAYHYSEYASGRPNRETDIYTRTVTNRSEHPEVDAGMPPFDMYQEIDELPVPNVEQPLMDLDTVISGDFSGRGLVVFRLDTEEVFYLEHVPEAEEGFNIPFEFDIEALPGGTQLEFYSVYWQDIIPVEGEDWTYDDIRYWWNQDSVLRSLPYTVTVQVTPATIDTIHTELGVTTVTGGALTADEVVLYVDGQEIAVIPVGEDGTFSTEIDAYIPAGTTVQAVARMAANGAVSEPIEFDEVTEVVAAPIVDPLTDSSQSVTGTVANPNVPITISVNGEVLVSDLMPNPDGTFEYPLENYLGMNDEVTVSQSGPNIESGEATEIVEGSLPEFTNWTPDGAVVNGTGAPGRIVVVTNEDDEEIGRATVDEDGNFTVEFTEPVEDGQVIRYFYEPIGDSETEVGEWTVELPLVDIDAPTLDPVTEDSTSITGVAADPTRPVVLEIGDVRVEVIPDEDGNFEYPLDSPLPEGTEIVGYQEDDDGYAGNSTTIYVEAGAADPIAAPTLDTVTEDSTVITGVAADPERPVVIEIDGERYVTTPNPDGSFQFPLEEPLTAGTEIVAYQEDDNGNPGDEASTVVEPGEPELFTPPTVDDVVHTDTEITGTVDPENAGYDVIVRDPEGNEIGRATPDDEGNFSIPVEGLEPGQELEVVQVDEDGNDVSEPTPITVGEGEDDGPVDPDLFPFPRVDGVLHTDTEVTGTVDPEHAGYDIVVRDADGNEIGRATPNEDGSFNVPVEGLEPGQTLSVVQVDEDGNNVSLTTPIIVGEGEEEPDLFPEPQVDEVVHTDDAITGTVDPENAGYDVIIRDPEGNEIGRATPNEDGSFSIPIEGLEPGQELEVVQVDEDGNDVSEPTPITVGEGEEDPTDPELFPEPQVDDVVHTDDAITGTVDPENAGYDVIVRDPEGNEIGRATPDDEGNFSIPVEGLEPGQELEVVQVDEDGNEVSEPTPITVGEGDEDDVPSDPDLVDPPQVNDIVHTDPEVTGTVDPENAGYDVIIRDPEGNEIGRATPDDEGNFSIPVEGLEPGQELEVVQVDEDGNDVSQPTPITVGEGDEEDDPTDPELLTPPTVDDVDHTDPEVTGTVDPENAGYDVIIRDPEGNEIGRGTPDDEGNFTIPVEGLEPGQELEVVQVDEDGNDVSQPTPITVGEGEDDSGIDPIIEDIPAPTLDPITDQDTVITGEATEDTMAVVLYVNGVEIARISPEEFNSPFEYSLDGPLPAGTVVQARHINSAGELGGVATRIVTSTETPTDPDPIPAPDVQTPGVGDEGISGVVADPSRPVVIIVGEDRYEVMPNPDGSFHLDLDEPLRPGTVVTIFQVDEDGHPGESVTFVVGEGLVSRDIPETSRESQRRTFGERLPDTATTVWALGAAGLGLTLLGLATKVMKKIKK
jgi:hypothetical protein